MSAVVNNQIFLLCALVKQETSLIELSFQEMEECSLHDNLHIYYFCCHCMFRSSRIVCVCLNGWFLQFCNGNQVCYKMLFSKGHFYWYTVHLWIILHPLHLMKFISASASWVNNKYIYPFLCICISVCFRHLLKLQATSHMVNVSCEDRTC